VYFTKKYIVKKFEMNVKKTYKLGFT